MTLILPFFNSQNKKVLTGSAPDDPIQVLVDEYQAAATAKGYDYLGDEGAIYAKYEELVLNNTLNTNRTVIGSEYALKTVADEIQSALSLVKIDGEYPEILKVTTGAIFEDGIMMFSKVGSVGSRGLIINMDYGSASFFTELEGEMYYNSGIVYFLQPTGGISGSARLLINTSNRQYSITYNQDGTSSGNNTGNNYFLTTGSAIYRTEYVRTGDSVVVRVLRNGVLINTFNRTWNGLIDAPYALLSSAGVTMKLKRFEIGIL